MSNQTTAEEPTPIPLDEDTLNALQERLFVRLQESLLAALREDLRREQPLPLYYDRFIGSETKRLEEAIARSGERIEEVRKAIVLNSQRIEEVIRSLDAFKEHVEQRFEKVDRQFHEMNTNFRNWTLAVIGILGLLITVLNFLK